MMSGERLLFRFGIGSPAAWDKGLTPIYTDDTDFLSDRGFRGDARI